MRAGYFLSGEHLGCERGDLNPHALRHRILSPALDVFSDHLRSYSAGNIRVISESTSSQITQKKPKVGTEWALKSVAESREDAPQSEHIIRLDLTLTNTPSADVRLAAGVRVSIFSLC
jgi:hypothetical protein